ncbi:MAG: hypothetical protein KDC79_00990 [Cyclobacteriaceae bacterium]|nr:hypothetical protein [Cyclobacteriaceae bacterium]
MIVGLLVVNLWLLHIEYLNIGVLAIGVLSILFEKIAFGINWLWMKFAHGLGWVNSKILLSILYYIFLVPIAFLAKVFKGSSIDLKGNKESIYKSRDHMYSKKDLENMW